MKLLFLDFDGVLNNVHWYVSRAARAEAALEWKEGKPRRRDADLDPRNMRRLAELAAAVPDLHIVVSSSWRFGRTLLELRRILEPAWPAKRVIGMTGSHESRMRHREIENWLENCGHNNTRYIALDDDTFDMKQLGQNFLHVDRQYGLTRRHVQQVVDHFSDYEVILI